MEANRTANRIIKKARMLRTGLCLSRYLGRIVIVARCVVEENQANVLAVWKSYTDIEYTLKYTAKRMAILVTSC